VIIDGLKKASVIRFEKDLNGIIDENTVIQELTLTNGYAQGEGVKQGGGGMYFYNASPGLFKVCISNNTADSNGGGIYCCKSSPTLTNLTIIDNVSSSGGGGIYGNNDSDPFLQDVVISGNSTTFGDGGGMLCHYSDPELINVVISKNISFLNGGGIFCTRSRLNLTNVTITENSAYGSGGGIYCVFNSNLSIVNVTVSENMANSRGGGISCSSSTLNFDKTKRCSIFFNNAGYGNDLYSYEKLNLYLNYFTVKNPNIYHAAPLANFSFDIYQGKLSQKNYDLYVSPDGDNANTGRTPTTPLKNIYYALSIIKADQQNPRTIFLDSGIYSKNTTGEKFPISMIEYVSIEGKGEKYTLLDGNNENTIVHLNETSHTSLKKLTIINGKGDYGGGMFCSNSSPELSNLTIVENISTGSGGGGIYCVGSNPEFSNITITNNSAKGNGGGIYFHSSIPILSNVNILGNTCTYKGGGLHIYDSEPNLSNVNIISNQSGYEGGGIYCDGSTLHFDSINRCNVFDNKAELGNDFYSKESIDIVLDTFTVKAPTSYHVYPIKNFSFDINHGKTLQKNYDLYISTEGNNENSGDSPESPLKNIYYALSIIQADQTNQRTIYLSSGVYSENTNGEIFPINIVDFVSIEGQDKDTTIFDGNKNNLVIKMENIHNVNLRNITIINGYRNGPSGIYCRDSSSNISNVVIKNNHGGGFECSNSSVILSDMIITENFSGSGIYFSNSSSTLTNVIITKNTTEYSGGGINVGDSGLTLSNVRISENIAKMNGGGICCSNTSFIFDSKNRCNIFLNQCAIGSDIYSYSEEPTHIILDLFTVKYPNAYLASPLNKLTFDILQGQLTQKNDDLYISTHGDNSNTGTSPESPLKNIYYALSVIQADQNNPRTIYLNSGEYSEKTNNEIYPINIIDYITIKGLNEEDTILNGMNTQRVIYIENVKDISIENVTICNGEVNYSDGMDIWDNGGGIYCSSANPKLFNITIKENFAAGSGGGIYFYNSNPILTNVTIANNSTNYACSGIFCYDSDAIFINNTITNNSSKNNYGNLMFDSCRFTKFIKRNSSNRL
jgi:predicted outer membrane repeat protein/parallel beta-helix repeat protein